MTDTMQVFTATLALLANLALAGLLVGLAVRRRSEAADDLVTAAGRLQLWLAFAVAATATLGSLYFSEIADFEPCKLCWFQRIFMYPLAVILLIAAVRRDRGVKVYAIPLAVIGACVATYHFLLERFPDLASGACSALVPCNVPWFTEYGFVTLSYMALSGFLLVVVLLVLPTTSLSTSSAPAEAVLQES